MEPSTSKLVVVAALSAAASSLLTYAVFKVHQMRRRAGYSDAHASSRPVAELAQPSSGLTVKRRDPFDSTPRDDHLTWDDYFMAVAFLSAQRSKDPNKQVGACIVDSRQVICGIGYNGFPRGCPDTCLPWAKQSADGDPLATKYPYVCHAEMNAILNKNGASVAGARVFVTMFPCNECAKLLIQAGISEVVYHEDKSPGSYGSKPGRRPDSPNKDGFRRDQQYAASRRLLSLAGVKVRQHLFRRPVTLHLTNNSYHPVVVSATLEAPPAEDQAAAARTRSGEGSGSVPCAAIAQACQAGAQALQLANGDTAAMGDRSSDAAAPGMQDAVEQLSQQPEQHQQQQGGAPAVDPALAAALRASGDDTSREESEAARANSSSSSSSGDESTGERAQSPRGTSYHAWSSPAVLATP